MLFDINPLSEQTPWQRELQQSITQPAELFDYLQLPDRHLPAAEAACRLFPLQVTPSFMARMQKGNWHDPLLRQILPIAAEQQSTPGYLTNPVGDSQAAVIPGLLHKYHNRVLLLLTGHCAVNCRYCFRRHFAYQDHKLTSGQWQQVMDYLQQHQIKEVILSGGDPLTVSDRRLSETMTQLEAMRCVQVVRIHTRLPIVLPSRITPALTQRLQTSRLKVVMVIHSNHPQEFDVGVDTALQQLKQAGVLLMNQTVLLRGINDDVVTLAQLSWRLLAADVLPYYLHVFDKTQNAAHFDLPSEQAISLIDKLQQQLPGYLVPQLVQEQAGQPSKTRMR